MSLQETEDSGRYRVVINHEEQYSIWPVHLEVPNGWKSIGNEASKAECLEHIKTVWTDIRPRSLRLRDVRDRS